MRIVDEKLIDEKAEKFFNEIGKMENPMLYFNKIDCLRRVSQMLETRSMLNCFLSILLMPENEILKSEDEILKFYGYADEGEFNNDIFKAEKYNTIERIKKTKSLFQSYLYYYTFFVKAIKMGIK